MLYFFLKVFTAVKIAAHKNLSFAFGVQAQNLYQYVVFEFIDRIYYMIANIEIETSKDLIQVHIDFFSIN